jgi:hypothetical protein
MASVMAPATTAVRATVDEAKLGNFIGIRL